MAGKIPRNFIDDLLARTDIVDLIDSKVGLKKAGKDYQACCPFHNEKSPSFTVSQDKQFYHCFGCGVNGNAISFVMEYEKLEFVDAIEELASLLNLEVPREQGSGSAPERTAAQKRSDYDLMLHTARFYQHQLKHHSNSAAVIEYVKGRGLSGEIVKKFMIGYAPSEWDGLCLQLGRNKEQKEQLVELKLASEKTPGRQFDFFRDRLMFPIRDKRGRVVAFGGRVMQADQGPKYLNSPETRIFHKGFELYGLYEAKQAHKKLDHVLIVEGYMDVVALAEQGIEYAVAALGTATTSEHMHTLFRTTDKVICCYDGDRAGRDAAWRALENALPYLNDGKALNFVFLPDGEDPDSLVQAEGKDKFEQRLNAADDFTKVLFNKLSLEIDLTLDSGKAKLLSAALPLIEKIPSEFYQENILEQLGRLIGRTREQLNNRLKTPKQQHSIERKFKITPMRQAIGILIQHPQMAKSVPYLPDLAQMNIAGIGLLLRLQHQALQKEDVTTAQLLEFFRGTDDYDPLTKLATWQHQINEERLETVFQNTFKFIEDQCLNYRLETLLIKDKTQGLNSDERLECHLLMTALKATNS
ncbi:MULTISPECIES: DNA primase [Pseudoalteromonas]|uniref:DNA primase n=3 Tax=Pseudoalteromonas TaxID=53246 RepID=Q3IIB8_PSET1|nr:MULTISPECIES: DNA primase [Pseudoalteromonas]ALS31739.1 DNA primase [Pseudoalteromonas translucida KMM 520]ASM52723.1 DNA primase [Pseudoalteromonas nigrifaciens]MBB1369997.1 DNA primase [Pseudoalteromonas sp. SR45-4]MBB1406922.1 DNA primase [Pseudoalteromonas sp. SG44-5]MBE0421636.1 DNA primase [Pseudoalteromonas nigrifaciens]|tara:strand:- start:9103 stop:10854 length:1752 start_codon:yes stop_codon:yes gene_type:complete